MNWGTVAVAATIAVARMAATNIVIAAVANIVADIDFATVIDLDFAISFGDVAIISREAAGIVAVASAVVRIVVIA